MGETVEQHMSRHLWLRSWGLLHVAGEKKKKTVLGGRSRGKSMGSRPPWFSDQVPGEPEL